MWASPLAICGFTGVRGWTVLSDEIGSRWKPQLFAQLHKYLLGVTPVRSVANVAAGLRELLVAPIAPSPLRGLRHGSAAFARSLVEESMSLTSCVLLFMQGVLEQLDVAVAELAPSAPLDTLGGGDEPVASTHYTASPVAPSRDGQGCTLQ